MFDSTLRKAGFDKTSNVFFIKRYLLNLRCIAALLIQRSSIFLIQKLNRIQISKLNRARNRQKVWIQGTQQRLTRGGDRKQYFPCWKYICLSNLRKAWRARTFFQDTITEDIQRKRYVFLIMDQSVFQTYLLVWEALANYKYFLWLSLHLGDTLHTSQEI